MFLSETCFGTEFREFASTFFTEWNGLEWNSESLLLSCSMVQNFKHSSPLRNGSERTSECFLFLGTDGIPPEQTSCSVYSFFRGIIFLSEIANPNSKSYNFPAKRPRQKSSLHNLKGNSVEI
jgi:hypothetical protein